MENSFTAFSHSFLFLEISSKTFFMHPPVDPRGIISFTSSVIKISSLECHIVEGVSKKR